MHERERKETVRKREIEIERERKRDREREREKEAGYPLKVPEEGRASSRWWLGEVTEEPTSRSGVSTFFCFLFFSLYFIWGLFFFFLLSFL